MLIRSPTVVGPVTVTRTHCCAYVSHPNSGSPRAERACASCQSTRSQVAFGANRQTAHRGCSRGCRNTEYRIQNTEYRWGRATRSVLLYFWRTFARIQNTEYRIQSTDGGVRRDLYGCIFGGPSLEYRIQNTEYTISGFGFWCVLSVRSHSRPRLRNTRVLQNTRD